MASIKFGGLVLGVIIVSLALKYSSAACAQEGVQRKMAKINAGRKVLVGRNSQKGGDETDHHEEKEGSSNYPKPEISGATCLARSCYNFEGKMRSLMNRKLQNTSRDETNVAKPRKLYMVGLVASRGDYHGPRHHPPKNN